MIPKGSRYAGPPKAKKNYSARTRPEPRTYSTPKELLDLALNYCARRETSRPKLKQYFLRKLPRDLLKDRESEEATQTLAVIEQVLDECVRMKIIDHERYAGMLSRDYARRGKGKRYVEQKLKEKGLSEQYKTMEFTPDDELSRAIELLEKTLRRSSIEKIEDPYKKQQKLLQKLVQSGFEFSIAKKAINLKK